MLSVCAALVRRTVRFQVVGIAVHKVAESFTATCDEISLGLQSYDLWLLSTHLKPRCGNLLVWDIHR